MYSHEDAVFESCVFLPFLYFYYARAPNVWGSGAGLIRLVVLLSSTGF